MTRNERVMTDFLMALAIEMGITPKQIYKTMTDDKRIHAFAREIQALALVDETKAKKNHGH